MHSPPPTPEPYRWRWLILVVMLVAEVMDLLDASIVNVVSPALEESLGRPGRPAVGDRRLRPHPRRRTGARRAPRRPLRPPPDVPARPGRLHRHLPALRAGPGHRLADRLPAAPGHRRGDAAPAGPRPAAGELLRPRADQGVRDLRARPRAGRDRRAGARRRADRGRPLRPGLALGLPGQPADRPRRPARRREGRPPEAGRPHRTGRPDRRRTGRGLLRPAGAAAEPGSAGRLAALDLAVDGRLPCSASRCSPTSSAGRPPPGASRW